MFESGVPPSRAAGFDDPSMVAMEHVVWQGLMDVFESGGNYDLFIRRVESGFHTIMRVEAPPPIVQVPSASIQAVPDDTDTPKTPGTPTHPPDGLDSREAALAQREKELAEKEASIAQLLALKEAALAEELADIEAARAGRSVSSIPSQEAQATAEEMRRSVYREVFDMVKESRLAESEPPSPSDDGFLASNAPAELNIDVLAALFSRSSASFHPLVFLLLTSPPDLIQNHDPSAQCPRFDPTKSIHRSLSRLPLNRFPAQEGALSMILRRIPPIK